MAKHGFGLNLKREDFRCLIGRNYLNDQIIDQYLILVQRRNESSPDLPKVQACTTFLYTKLKKCGLEEGSKQTERWLPEDLLEKDLILFPIHNQHHWSLIVAETQERTIHYFDSLEGSRQNSPAPGMIKNYMERCHREKGEEAQYRIKIREDAPLQTNGVDCGVFLCQYAERVARKSGMSFTQRDMAQARERMIDELLEGKVFSDWGRYKGRIQPDKGGTKQKKTKKAKGSTNRTNKVKKDAMGEGTKPRGDGGDRKERIDWPKANSTEWERLDQDLTEVLRVQGSSPENKSIVHPLVIYTLSLERFGVRGNREKPQPRGPSKRQSKCKRLRGEINKLKETYFQAEEGEKEAVQQLQEEKLKELRLAKRAESLRKRRKTFSKNCNQFLSSPFDFARDLLAPKPKGKLESTKEIVEEHLQEAHGMEKEEEKDVAPDFLEQEQPEIDFDDSLPTWHEFNRKLRKARNNSAPGPNGVPYLVYKKCPGVARLLYGYLKGIWRKNIVSKAWRKAEGIFIPKEEGAKDVGKFRTISLLNVEGKLYFAMKADRLIQYAMANGYIDTSI